MKKYNLSKIMNRAWEIKKEEDRLKLNRKRNLYPATSRLEDNEKALFSICLKMAWAESRKASEIEKELKVTADQAAAIVEKETELGRKYNGAVRWSIWNGYGKCRAYYKISGLSSYQNSKKDNFIAL